MLNIWVGNWLWLFWVEIGFEFGLCVVCVMVGSGELLDEDGCVE